MLQYKDLTPEQSRAVAETLAEYLLPRDIVGEMDMETVVSPILSGIRAMARPGCNFRHTQSNGLNCMTRPLIPSIQLTILTRR
jgi:hypothetical protein